jgi:hypothetical protein
MIRVAAWSDCLTQGRFPIFTSPTDREPTNRWVV